MRYPAVVTKEGKKVTHLVAIFGKREKADLSPAERKAVAALVRKLKEEAS
jgi:hypothetical protein